MCVYTIDIVYLVYPKSKKKQKGMFGAKQVDGSDYIN